MSRYSISNIYRYTDTWYLSLSKQYFDTYRYLIKIWFRYFAIYMYQCVSKLVTYRQHSTRNNEIIVCCCPYHTEVLYRIFGVRISLRKFTAYLPITLSKITPIIIIIVLSIFALLYPVSAIDDHRIKQVILLDKLMLQLFIPFLWK